MAKVRAVWTGPRAEVSLSGETAADAQDDLGAGMALHAKLDRAVGALMPDIEILLDELQKDGTFLRPEGAALQSAESGALTVRFIRQPPLTEDDLALARDYLEHIQK